MTNVDLLLTYPKLIRFQVSYFWRAVPKYERSSRAYMYLGGFGGECGITTKPRRGKWTTALIQNIVVIHPRFPSQLRSEILKELVYPNSTSLAQKPDTQVVLSVWFDGNRVLPIPIYLGRPTH